MSVPENGIARQSFNLVNRLLGMIGVRVVREPSLAAVDHEGHRYHYEMVTVPRYAPWVGDAAFQDVYRLVTGSTLVDRFRCYELYQLVREVASIEGDVIEVGVWRGGTGAILARAAARWRPGCKVWLCDTFRGVVKAGARDSMYSGGEHADTSLQLVQDLVKKLALDNVELLEGIFPDDTAHRLGERRIALAHIDVDVYQSALDVVSWVTGRMPVGGVLVFDDYGFRGCDGVTRLVDELRDSGGWSYVYNLNGHAILTRRPPAV